jgi:hypothetical protein
MSTALTFRALAALPQPLQAMARAHVQQHPCDDLGELISELALAALELTDRSTDAAHNIYARARSRLRRATQDVAHYSVTLDIERHDTAADDADDEPSLIRRQDIVLDVQQRKRVTLRRAQQLVRRQIERAAQGDLFIADEIAGVSA